MPELQTLPQRRRPMPLAAKHAVLFGLECISRLLHQGQARVFDNADVITSHRGGIIHQSLVDHQVLAQPRVAVQPR
eukprot:16439055-Heterocapsa_arctica.AAC.1